MEGVIRIADYGGMTKKHPWPDLATWRWSWSKGCRTMTTLDHYRGLWGHHGRIHRPNGRPSEASEVESVSFLVAKELGLEGNLGMESGAPSPHSWMMSWSSMVSVPRIHDRTMLPIRFQDGGSREATSMRTWSLRA